MCKHFSITYKFLIQYNLKMNRNIIYWPKACLTTRPVRAMMSVSKAELYGGHDWMETLCGSVSALYLLTWMGAKFTADAVLSVSEELIQRAWISTFPPQSGSPCTSSLPKNSNRCVTRLHTRLQFTLKTSDVPGSIHLYTVQHICLRSYLYKSRKIMHIFNILASRARKLTSRLFHVAYCMSNYKYIPEHITMSFEPCFFLSMTF